MTKDATRCWRHSNTVSWGRPPEYDDKPCFPIYRRVNGCQTWSKFSELRDTQSEWGLRYQPDLFELTPDIGPRDAGTVLVDVNSIPNDLSETSLEFYASEDHGKTGEYVSTIVTSRFPMLTADTVGINGKIVLPDILRKYRSVTDYAFPWRPGSGAR